MRASFHRRRPHGTLKNCIRRRSAQLLMIGSRISVLIVDNAVDFGGSIVSTANLIRGLDRTRFEPIFVSSTSEPLVRSKLSESSQHTRVFIARPVLDYRRLGRIKSVIARLPNSSFQRALIYVLYAIRMLVNVPYALKMAALIHRYSVDIVQVNNAFGNDELELVCLVMRRPRVVFFRGYIPLSAIERRLFLPGTKAFVSVAEHVKETAVADGVPANRIVVATPPAIVEQIDPVTLNSVRQRYGVQDGDLTFGVFGRVVGLERAERVRPGGSHCYQGVPASKGFYHWRHIRRGCEVC